MTAGINLIAADGRINRGAVLLDARRQFRLMGRFGWDWPQCVKYSWSRARAMQHDQLLDQRDIDLARPIDDPQIIKN